MIVDCETGFVLGFVVYTGADTDYQKFDLGVTDDIVAHFLQPYFYKGHDVYRVRHIKCYRAIALNLLIISKNVSDKSFIVREGRHTRPPYFFIGGGAKAMSRSTPLF